MTEIRELLLKDESKLRRREKHLSGSMSLHRSGKYNWKSLVFSGTE
jgi:hypothetical protein